MTTPERMEEIVSLAKRRGFIFPGSEIYGGLQNSWDYGPLGAELKKNIKDRWWKVFVRSRSDMVGLDAALIMNPRVWETSGHLSTFNDPLVECKKCHARYRADQVDLSKACPHCGTKGTFTEPRQFNMMLQTFLGPAEENANIAYFRPEIAQAMFVNFKNILDTNRMRLPFGIASQGMVFRNEITPGNFIFRTREFDLMEFEYFIHPKDWKKTFEYWLEQIKLWLGDLGVQEERLHFVEIPKEDRAHYSQRTVDIEYDYPFGQKELYGIAYRGDFDLSNHAKASGADLRYLDPKTREKFIPHVIEPSFGLSRSVLVMLLEAYRQESDRIYLALPTWAAPYKVAVFPLLANKPQLVEKAREVHTLLTAHDKFLPVAWDDRSNVGKRYYAQDEIGTPYCVTIDFDSLADHQVTVRDRDTMEQERVPINDLAQYLSEKL
jgi:glycyl-tRNA synthetase